MTKHLHHVNTNVILLLTIFSGIALLTLAFTIPFTAAATPNDWQATLRFNGPSEVGNSLIFGKSINASDGQDALDNPKPPAPPMTPYLDAWFRTGFAPPFNNLRQEYKNASTEFSFWNLSVQWVADSENAIADITISWTPNQFSDALVSCELSHNGTMVANMFTTSSYEYQTDGSIENFQIMTQNKPDSTPQPVDNNNQGLPVSLLALGFIIIVIVVILIAVILRRKRN